eukprot:755442-Hanusia_phi.AAC.3
MQIPQSSSSPGSAPSSRPRMGPLDLEASDPVKRHRQTASWTYLMLLHASSWERADERLRASYAPARTTSLLARTANAASHSRGLRSLRHPSRACRTRLSAPTADCRATSPTSRRKQSSEIVAVGCLGTRYGAFPETESELSVAGGGADERSRDDSDRP